MWRFLHRQQSRFVCRRNGAMSFVGLASVIAGSVLGLAHDAWAQDEQLSIAGQADRSIVIREHAGWNRGCEAIAHPALYLSEPPSHGSVCARIEDIKISSMYVGTESQCVGHLVRGVRLIYRPDATYAGDDSLRYAAQYPSVLRTIQVQIAVAAHAAGATGAVPSNVVAPMAQARQAPGPVPACADPIF
jgi:hypothetical protein